MSAFKFSLGQQARIAVSGETGQVVGRGEYTTTENTYFLRYKSADGRAVTQWWDESALQSEAPVIIPGSVDTTIPPEPGQPWQGGIYAGIAAADDDQPAGHIVLLADLPADLLTWQQAVAWAQSLGDGARLPTRFESALLYANLRDQIECDDWYWTGTQYSGDYAWQQFFDNGYQDYSYKGDKVRARAVRRFILESFNPLVSEA